MTPPGFRSHSVRGGGVDMATKVVKLAAVPAVLGLSSFQVFAMTEEKPDKQLAPRELSIYSTEPPALRYVEETPGRLQTRLGLMRMGLQHYIRAAQNTCTSVKVGAVSLYQAGEDTYNFLRDPPPGFLPRVGIITVSGLAGLILARKGSRLKRIGFPLALTTAATAVCYPMYTVGALKVTGKKVYAASSWVASVFKSKQDGIVPDVNLEHAKKVGPQPDELPEKVPSKSEGEFDSEASSDTEVFAPVPEDSPTAGVATEFTPASQAVDIAESGVESLVEDSPLLDLTPVPGLAPEDVIPSASPPGGPVVELAPQEKANRISGDVALEAEMVPTEKAPVAADTQLSGVRLGNSTLEEAVSPTEDALVLDTAPFSDATSGKTLAVAPPAKADPPIVEEATPPALDVEEAKPAKEITTYPPVKEKPQFVPDPSLSDHGQAHPEDADLYSKRG